MKYIVTSAIILLSAIMILGALSPSIAAEKGGNSQGNNGDANGGQKGGEKSPKHLICHYSGKSWNIMYVNGNALENHLIKHNDGTLYDFVINSEDDDSSNSSSACLARNG